MRAEIANIAFLDIASPGRFLSHAGSGPDIGADVPAKRGRTTQAKRPGLDVIRKAVGVHRKAWLQLLLLQ
jgi:hypothetical protein